MAENVQGVGLAHGAAQQHDRAVTRILRQVCAIAVPAALLFAMPEVRAQEHTAHRGAVATENETATAAALEVLRAGGHAVDAAIAASLVLGVTTPVSSGIGGGGFALVYEARSGKVTALDFRETAPAAIEPRVLDARPLPDDRRGALVGVPGEIAGLLELHARWGRRLFALDLEPAVRAAEQGFPVSPHMERAIRDGASGVLRVSPPLLGRFTGPSGPLSRGAIVRNTKLGATLRLIGTGGRAAFYGGPIAADLAGAVRAHGGAMSERDLASYSVTERTALQVPWHGATVHTMPPPSAGGLLLAQTLGMHPASELRGMGRASADLLHVIAETFRSSIADRMSVVGDPSKVQVPLEQLVSDQHLRDRKARISRDRTHAATAFAQPEGGTSHLVVVDRDRNVVSLTTTVNNAFGSRIVAPASGVLLNDELDDFTPPATARLFGHAGGGPNGPRAVARPVSSMTPAIVMKDGRPVLAIGGSGGMSIPQNVTQVLIDLMVFDTPADEAIRAPRFGVTPTTTALLLEEPWPPQSVIDDLKRRGEQVEKTSYPAAVQFVRIDATGRLEARSDGRKWGSAAAF